MRSIILQQSQQFIPRNQKLSPERPARSQTLPLDQPINAEIIYSKKVSRFLNGIGEAFFLPKLSRRSLAL